MRCLPSSPVLVSRVTAVAGLAALATMATFTGACDDSGFTKGTYTTTTTPTGDTGTSPPTTTDTGVPGETADTGDTDVPGETADTGDSGGHRPVSDEAVAAEWQVWIAGELLDGTPDAEILAVLAGRGLAGDRARAELDAIRASPAFVVAARDRRGDRQATQLRALLAAHAVHAPPDVEERPLAAVDDEIRRARADHRPVRFPGLAADWPAVREWSLDELVRRVGTVEVEACWGRRDEAEPDRFFDRLLRRQPFAEVAAAVASGAGDDVYLIANNAAFPALSGPLLADLAPPAIVAHLLDRSTRFWFGGAGTFTRLHCDDVDLLFVQVVGSKQWWLTSPAHEPLLHHLRGYYPQYDLRDPPAGVTVRGCVLGPGDALFLPAGWWHQVLALDTSISTSFVGFDDRNHYAGYRPGLPDDPRS